MFFGQGMEHLEERNMVLCEDVHDTEGQGVTQAQQLLAEWQIAHARDSLGPTQHHQQRIAS